MRALRAAAWAISGALFLWVGCAGPSVQIRALVPAEVDLLSRSIDSLAVMPLSGDAEVAAHATESLTTKLGGSEFFKIAERARLDQVVAEVRRGLSDLFDPKTAAEAGRLLGVKALVVGQVLAYRIVDTPYTKQVKKQVGTGQFQTVGSGRGARQVEIMRETLVSESHVRREAVLSVSLRVVEVATGRIVASRTADAALKYDTGAEPLIALFSGMKTEIPARETSRRDLVEAVAAQFFKYVSPRYVTLNRPLESLEGPVDTGVRFAQAGSLEEAVRIWTEYVQAHSRGKEAFYNLGVAYEAMGRFDQAREAYRQAVRIEAKDLYIEALANLDKQIRERKKLEPTPAGGK